MVAWILLIIGTLVAFYILIGYPLLLAMIARRSVRPDVHKDTSFRPRVSVILAVHNGEAFLREKLNCLLTLNYPPELVEVIVVSDGSTDDTEMIADEFTSSRVMVLRKQRGGKSAALNVALKQASGEILFLTDVRQKIDADALIHLVGNFADPSVGAVTGELRMLYAAGQGEDADFGLYWRYELWVRAQHSRIDSIFTATGCIYAVRRALVGQIPNDTLTDDAVIPLKAFFQGYRVVFDPEALAFDYPTAAGGEFRRKLRTLGGLWQLHARMPHLFTSANRMRFHFLSHKFGRLMLPWAILLIWIGTIGMAGTPFGRFLLVDELTLIAMALIDPLIPAAFPLKRLSSPARTFLTMNAAALCSVAVFFVAPTRLWRPTQVKVTR